MTRIATSLLFAIALPVCAYSAPCSPGAEGWGTETAGGRGGQIIIVTSLADSGPGTLREAINTTGPRTILFDVAGIIRLQSPLELGGPWDPATGDNPYSNVSILGHSAPGGGVTIAGAPFRISNGVHDVVIRHIRVRDVPKSDGFSLMHDLRRIVLDHCSVSWATDENIGFIDDCKDVTISNCVIAECLIHGGHSKGSGHSMGALISRGAHRVSFHHNFLTGNRGRNPIFVGDNRIGRDNRGTWILHPVFDCRNNIVYNYSREGTSMDFGARLNIVRNLYVAGPDTRELTPEILERSGLEEVNLPRLS